VAYSKYFPALESNIKISVKWPIGLGEVRTPTLLRQTDNRWAAKLSALRAGRTLPPGFFFFFLRLLVLISVRG
jgi:hypothetical protein